MNDAQELFREGVRAIREQGDMERGRMPSPINNKAHV